MMVVFCLDMSFSVKYINALVSNILVEFPCVRNKDIRNSRNCFFLGLSNAN